MHSIWVQIGNRKNDFNLMPDIVRNILTKEDGRFMKIGTLT